MEFITLNVIFTTDNIFDMSKLMGSLKRLSLPFALLFVLLSGGVAIVESCHTQISSEISTVVSSVIHSHPDGSHSHLASTPTTEPLGTTYEACFAIGFVVLLFIRFFKLKLQHLRVRSVELLKMKIMNFQEVTASYLNLSHIQLGVIRI